MAECYLHNQYPKIANEDLGLSIKFYIQQGSLEELRKKYGVLETESGAIQIDSSEAYGAPSANTIWICASTEYPIKKIVTNSLSLPVGEEGLCVIWNDQRGLTGAVYVWQGTSDKGSWLATDAFLYNNEYQWVKITSTWNGVCSDWLYYFSNTTGEVINELEKQAIIGGGDSRFLSIAEEFMGAYDYIEIDGCYANTDVSIGLLRISDQEFETWGISNFASNYLTIKAKEFKDVDEEEGLSVRIKIPKPTNAAEASSSNFPSPYLGYRIGVFASSLNIPSNTIIQFHTIKFLKDLTGEAAITDNYYTQNKKIGGILRP